MTDERRRSSDDHPRTLAQKYDAILGRVLRLGGVAGVVAYVYFGLMLGKDVEAAFLWICALMIHSEKALDFLSGKLK